MQPNGSAAHSPEASPISDAESEAEILRLAGLADLAYGRERKAAGEKLGLSLAWVDKLVKNKKADIAAEISGIEPCYRVSRAPVFRFGVGKIPAFRSRRLWIGNPCQRADLAQHVQDAGNALATAISPAMKGVAAGLIGVRNADDLAASQRRKINVPIGVAAAGPGCRDH